MVASSRSARRAASASRAHLRDLSWQRPGDALIGSGGGHRGADVAARRCAMVLRWATVEHDLVGPASAKADVSTWALHAACGGLSLHTTAVFGDFLMRTSGLFATARVPELFAVAPNGPPHDRGHTGAFANRVAESLLRLGSEVLFSAAGTGRLSEALAGGVLTLRVPKAGGAAGLLPYVSTLPPAEQRDLGALVWAFAPPTDALARPGGRTRRRNGAGGALAGHRAVPDVVAGGVDGGRLPAVCAHAPCARLR